MQIPDKILVAMVKQACLTAHGERDAMINGSPTKTAKDRTPMLSTIYSFLKDPKTPDSSFYMTLLGLLGLVAHGLAGSSNPTFIAAGAALTGLYTLGHKIAEGLSAQAKPASASPPSPEAIAEVAKQTAIQVADQLMEKSVDLSVRLPQPDMSSDVAQPPQPAAASEPPAVSA